MMRQKLLDLSMCDIYGCTMYPLLHEILMKLDNEHLDTEGYFDWSEEDKQNLTQFICHLFRPILFQGEKHKQFLIASICKVIKECEMLDEYEQADIMVRCLNQLENDNI